MAIRLKSPKSYLACYGISVQATNLPVPSSFSLEMEESQGWKQSSRKPISKKRILLEKNLKVWISINHWAGEPRFRFPELPELTRKFGSERRSLSGPFVF